MLSALNKKTDAAINTDEKTVKAKVEKKDDDWDNWMDESQKELQNIFQGQSAMKEILTDLHRKMDDIISRQERAFNAITAIQVSQS